MLLKRIVSTQVHWYHQIWCKLDYCFMSLNWVVFVPDTRYKLMHMLDSWVLLRFILKHRISSFFLSPLVSVTQEFAWPDSLLWLFLKLMAHGLESPMEQGIECRHVVYSHGKLIWRKEKIAIYSMAGKSVEISAWLCCLFLHWTTPPDVIYFFPPSHSLNVCSLVRSDVWQYSWRTCFYLFIFSFGLSSCGALVFKVPARSVLSHVFILSLW